jgi:hypothetical protein
MFIFHKNRVHDNTKNKPETLRQPIYYKTKGKRTLRQNNNNFIESIPTKCHSPNAN